MDDTPGAHTVQPEKRRDIRPPLLVPDGLYDRETILNNLGISKKTYAAWERKGLPTVSPHTRRVFLFGHEVMAFLKDQR